MFCYNCGKQIENNMLFCPYCGSKVPSSVKEAIHTDETPAAAEIVTPEPAPAVIPVMTESPAEGPVISREIPAAPAEAEEAPAQTAAEEIPAAPAEPEVEAPAPAAEETPAIQAVAEEAPTPAAEETPATQAEAEEAPAPAAEEIPAAPAEAEVPAPAEPASEIAAANPQQPAIPAEEKKSHKKVIIIVIIAILVILAALFAEKKLQERKLADKYQQAVELYDSQQFEKAAVLFDELQGEGYLDSETYYGKSLEGIRYQGAIILYNDGKYQDALNMFIEDPVFLDAESYISKCRDNIAYAEAKAALEREEFSTARLKLSSISDKSMFADYSTLNSTAKNEPTYREALIALEEGKLYEAYMKFVAVSPYKDSAEKQKECVLPFPKTGILSQLSKYKSSQSAVTFKLDKAAMRPAYIRIYTADKETLAATLFVNQGDSVTIKLAPGKYILNRAGGTNWFGEEDMFGTGLLTMYNDIQVSANFFKDGIFTFSKNYTYTITMSESSLGSN